MSRPDTVFFMLSQFQNRRFGTRKPIIVEKLFEVRIKAAYKIEVVQLYECNQKGVLSITTTPKNSLFWSLKVNEAQNWVKIKIRIEGNIENRRSSTTSADPKNFFNPTKI